MVSLPWPLPWSAVLFIAALGLIFGSFITALSYRLPRGQSIARGRSACPSCGTTLTACDLVPLLSWIIQRGRCRYCRVSVSWRYPLTEAMMAILFVATALAADTWAHLVLILAATPVMVALAIIDIEHRRLPNSLLLVLAALFLLLRLSGDKDIQSAAVMCGLVFVAAIALDWAGRRLIRQGLGMGDAKLMTAAALALPAAPLLLAFAVAGMLGVGVALMSLLTKRQIKPHFPFGLPLLIPIWAAIIAVY